MRYTHLAKFEVEGKALFLRIRVRKGVAYVSSQLEDGNGRTTIHVGLRGQRGVPDARVDESNEGILCSQVLAVRHQRGCKCQVGQDASICGKPAGTGLGLLTAQMPRGASPRGQ